MTKRSCSPRTSMAARPILTPTTSAGSTTFNAQGNKITSNNHIRSYFVSSLDGVYAYYVTTEEDYHAAIRDMQNAGSQLIALDLEGVNLSRTGPVSLLHVFDGKNVYIFDVLAVGHKMFGDGYLRELLASHAVTKIMFDCRKDCEALFYQFQIALDNVIDVQMAEVVYRYKLTRSAPRHYVGLTSAVEQYNIVKSDHIASYSVARAAALTKYCPARGGRIEVWGERPLDKDLLVYCAEDIKCIYRLYTKVFAKRLSFETCIGVSLIRIRETMQAHANTTSTSSDEVKPCVDDTPSPAVSSSPPTSTTAPIASPPGTPGGALKCYVNFDVALFSKFEDSMQQYKRMGFLKMCAQKC